MRLLSSMLLLALVWAVRGGCPAGVMTSLPFILEYALWRGWRQAVVYALDLEQDCSWAVVRLAKCLSVNGVATALAAGPRAPRLRHQLGVAVLAPSLTRNSANYLKKNLQQLFEGAQMNTNAYDWLISARTEQDFAKMNEVYNASSIRFDQTIVTSYPSNPTSGLTGLCDDNLSYRPKIGETECRHRNDRQCRRYLHENNYQLTGKLRNLAKNSKYKVSGRVKELLRSGLEYDPLRRFHMRNMTEIILKSKFKTLWHQTASGSSGGFLHLVQYVKIRKTSTLYGDYLGPWDRRGSMSKVLSPYPVEARNFLGESLVVGRCNSTNEGPKVDDDGPSAPILLDDSLQFYASKLNATAATKYFPQVGFRTYDGAWSGLLGALVEGGVDLALEPVTAHMSRHQDMDFIFPIAETVCNIYIHHQETSTVRDIFLAPFSSRLLLCVAAMALVAAATLAVISRWDPYIEGQRRVECLEALLWSTGILCQQGGNYTPSSPASCIVVIVCLVFGVVTYNAYAAFITSVLSVRVASVAGVADVLATDFSIGYIRNGPDQMYLMSTKDALLNALYIRGYSNAENLVTSTEEGLARAVRRDYAFFAGQRAARSTLRSMSQLQGRCALRELPARATRAQLAFPMTRNSPYARPALVSLLQLRSGGSLARLGAALVPPPPPCELAVGFTSARAADVSSALLLMATGIAAAALLGISEYCWKNKSKIVRFANDIKLRLRGLLVF